MALFKSETTESSAKSTDLGFLLDERVSRQWLGFLRAMSEEMQSQLTAIEYRDLLRSMGNRFAAAMPVGNHDTIDELQTAINRHLSSIRWGKAALSDSGTNLEIVHRFSPLAHGLGVDASVAGGFLEGLYDHWFHAAGADASLSVRQSAEGGDEVTSLFQLGRHP